MEMKIHRPQLLAVCLLGLISGGGLSAEAINEMVGPVLNPRKFTLGLGSLTVTNGQTLAIDTKGTTNNPTFSIGGVTNTGTSALNLSNSVQLAVFAFDSIDVQTGATVTVTGDRGLVLASRNNLTLNAGISLAGGDGVVADSAAAVGGPGGPGGECGAPGASFSSKPPGSSKGRGGNGNSFSSNPGVGYGAGPSVGVSLDRGYAGPGGGHAGRGADGGVSASWEGTDYVIVSNSGGKAYGDVLLTDLYGGSGGASGSQGRSYRGCGGGGGGGALELVAEGTLSVGNGRIISAKGGAGGTSGNGAGGGGSGGGLVLAARAVNLAGSTLNVSGGSSGGCGGSGGRIAIYANRYDTNSITIIRAGGTGGGGRNGATGSYNVADNGHPEFYPFRSLGTVITLR